MNKIFGSIYTFIFAGLLFIGCTYWIYKNVKLDDLIGKNSVPIALKRLEDTTTGHMLEIRNNDIVEVVSPDAVNLIIDGSKIDNMESLSDLTVSPDGKKICFLVHTITPIWLYTANVDGSNIKKIDLAINCVWSPDGTKVSYNNHTTDVSDTNVYVYYLTSGKIRNLTETPQQIGSVKIYEKPEWLSNSKIKAAYTITKLSDLSKQTQESTIEVPEN